MKRSTESFPAANMKRLCALCKIPRDAEGRLGSLHVGLGGLHSQHTASSYAFVFLKRKQSLMMGYGWLGRNALPGQGRLTGQGGPSCSVVTLTTSSTCAVCCDPITSHLSVMWTSPDALYLSLRAVYHNCPLWLCYILPSFLPQEREERAQISPPHTQAAHRVSHSMSTGLPTSSVPEAPLPAACLFPVRSTCTSGRRWGRAGAGQVACREA